MKVHRNLCLLLAGLCLTQALPVPEDSSGSGTAAASKDATDESKNVASTLSKGSQGLVAAASDDNAQRTERDSGYGAPSYGPNTVAETPNNFINVFSQAAANTVNFATQLLNSLVGVAANILQGTVSTILSLLNAKGQIVGAVVQSAPPVLASVTRTAGDVLAAKARIFGAVTQSLVNFASQLAQTVTNTFAGLFNGPNAINFSTRDAGDNRAGGLANLGQTIVNSQLSLLNGVLAPFVRGTNSGGDSSADSSKQRAAFPFSLGGLRSLFLGGGRGGGGGSSSSASTSDSNGTDSEPNFRITIGRATTASSVSEAEEGKADAPEVPVEPDSS
jgi:hypothetical protein